VSFKPTPNLEVAFSNTTLLAGKGVPMTPHTFVRSVLSLGNAAPGSIDDPGDRRAGFEFTYRIPKLRNWLSFYADGFTDDQFSPVAYADRSAWRSGVYAPRVPLVPKLDFRVEGVFTDVPAGGALSHGFYYSNARFRNGYTSRGLLLGSWVGRQGQGAQAWTTYNFNARNFLQFNFRHLKVSQQFIPEGGTLTDFGARAGIWLRPRLQCSILVQGESWLIPAIAAGKQHNVVATVQVSFWPNWKSGSR
jgi:hypothetical protein